ncbi:uncharacterized protein TNCT_109951, partial [Trichonephila clavata]
MLLKEILLGVEPGISHQYNSSLWTKLRATHANEPSQFRKAVRATLVLVPLFGLHFILVMYRPQNGDCFVLEGYSYFSYAMDGLQ